MRIKSGSENIIWFWDGIDEETRFLWAGHLSRTRTIQDAETFCAKAAEQTTTVPRLIVTDRLRAYLMALNVCLGEKRHISSLRGLATDTHNYVIERFHGTLNGVPKQ